MSTEPAYRIDFDGQDLVVRIRHEAVDQEQVLRFLDYLQLESIRRSSSLTEEDARVISGEVDRAVWARVRSHVPDGT
ncbi:MAG TPA: hypothetical protein VF615_23495 [Longimicrobiaceae bacterium]